MLSSPAPNPVFPTTLILKGLSFGNHIGEMPTGYSKGYESRKPGPSWVCRTVVNKKRRVNSERKWPESTPPFCLWLNAEKMRIELL